MAHNEEVKQSLPVIFCKGDFAYIIVSQALVNHGRYLLEIKRAGILLEIVLVLPSGVVGIVVRQEFGLGVDTICFYSFVFLTL